MDEALALLPCTGSPTHPGPDGDPLLIAILFLQFLLPSSPIHAGHLHRTHHIIPSPAS